MTRAEELETIKNAVAKGGYSQEEFKLFAAEYSWQDWMNDYTEAAEDEEISESESEEIDAILREGFNLVFECNE